MANSIITNKGKVILLNRAYKASPDYTAPTKFQLGTSQTTPLLTSTTLTSLVTIGAATSKTFVASYPSVNETTKEVTVRGYLSSTEGNGELIDGAGLINSTDDLHSLDQWNGESKSATDEFALIWVDRII